MLNTYAAVLESAFPEREIGMMRPTLLNNAVRFATSTPQTFTDLVTPGITRTEPLQIPVNTLQANVSISWGLSANDFGLKVYDPDNALLGQSNYLNLPGLTGRFESVVLRNPAPQTVRASMQHSGFVGTQQNVYGSVEVTQAIYPNLGDMNSLSPQMTAEVQRSMLSNVILPMGKRFAPTMPMSRFDMAAAFVRAGLVPQYLASSPMFPDARDVTTRNAVESCQTNPTGKLFYDASAGGYFYPNNTVTRLAAAIAFVKAAGLEGETYNATLPLSATDAGSIPSQYRGYVAVAINHGFLNWDGRKIDPYRGVTRLDAVVAFNRILGN